MEVGILRNKGKIYFACDDFRKYSITYIDLVTELIRACFGNSGSDNVFNTSTRLRIEIASVLLRRKRRGDLIISAALLIFDQGVYCDKEIITITSLCTRSGYRNQGYAKFLIEAIVDRLVSDENKYILNGDFVPESLGLINKYFSAYIFNPSPFFIREYPVRQPQIGSKTVFLDFSR